MMRRSRRRQRWLALALACGVLAGGCSRGGSSSDDGADADGRDGGLETPTFAEGDAGVVVSTSIGEASSDAATTTALSGADSTPTTSAAGEATPTTAASVRAETVGFDDPVGDATPGVATAAPPPWTDLAGASLTRRGNAYRLTVRLGGEAPQTAPGADTMNIATFYDVDDDGSVDYEIWVNLGSDGWGPVWYDDEGNAAPGERSNVNVVVKGNDVQLLFPDVMLDKPTKLRFSVASEYGPLSAIGSSAARRDDAPDDDRAVAFPG